MITGGAIKNFNFFHQQEAGQNKFNFFSWTATRRTPSTCTTEVIDKECVLLSCFSQSFVSTRWSIQEARKEGGRNPISHRHSHFSIVFSFVNPSPSVKIPFSQAPNKFISVPILPLDDPPSRTHREKVGQPSTTCMHVLSRAARQSRATAIGNSHVLFPW